MSGDAARDIAWFTRFARIQPLYDGHFDVIHDGGVWLHTTNPHHVVGRGVSGVIDVSARIHDDKRLVGAL